MGFNIKKKKSIYIKKRDATFRAWSVIYVLQYNNQSIIGHFRDFNLVKPTLRTTLISLVCVCVLGGRGGGGAEGVPGEVALYSSHLH